MRLYPEFTESLLINIGADQLIDRIRKATASAPPGNPTPATQEKIYFTGIVSPENFTISLRRNRPNMFGPMVQGKVEPTAEGCLVFLEYKFYPATRAYLTFWSIFVLTIGITGALTSHPGWSLAISITGLALIHWIARKNFTIHLEKLRIVIMQFLT